MDKSLPKEIDDQRRRTLLRYTFLALLSYQLPVGVAYLAIFFNIAKYDYSDIHPAYLSYIGVSILALILIRLKKMITKPFIYFMLHFQVFFCLIISAYMIYAMNDQRYLVPIGCLLILIFVFIQSTLFVSFSAILFFVSLYLSISYVGIGYRGQAGSFVGDVLYILIFVPVCIFIAFISKIMQDQQKKIKLASSRLKTTHAELKATHDELGLIHTELEGHNDRMIESIRYAEMIQRSLLPGIDRIKEVSPESMFIWMPKDIVGGDIFYTYAGLEVSIIAVMDCTGHGVPGAFLTMIVYSEIRKIIMDEVCRKPSDILKRLNLSVKNILYKTNSAQANDGLDAAVCSINHSEKKVTYAGARIPLFFVKDGSLHRINGDKQSIGYKHSIDNFDFTDYSIDIDSPCSFYIKTDGYTDQLGGDKRLRFGTDKFKDLIQQNHKKPYSDQRKLFLDALINYRGENEQIDDITLIGFNIQ
ncbi:MAG: SpoIIE family protein phosphatase [Proteobacteria bacterium]|nr:SpoIIE family protein phosphatase [Pseudomonadota bacterium]